LYACCRFVAISYDVKQKKPELSIAWAGDSISEKVGQWWCAAADAAGSTIPIFQLCLQSCNGTSFAAAQ
jgi:hypothetical protein